ncbi:MAG: phosphatidylglycerol lysyltransferase domain-containing protein [Lachnospiraceae bacterium]|nr:phosphatidylglycerol lysyltransferase domain-containing protein [Lachnospiraceae bacterium]
MLTDKEWMDRCRAEGSNDMTVISFSAVYIWRSIFGLTVDGDERFYVIKSISDEGYYYPVGRKDACRDWVRSMLSDGQPLKFVYVPKGELEWLESIGFETSYEPDTSEYVYSSRSMALLDNGAGSNYRSKIHNFSRDNEWSVEAFDFPADEEFLRRMIRSWADEPSSRRVPDRQAVLACAENPARAGLSGIHIETDTGEWAFLLGYPSTKEIYDMTIVKYSPWISRNVVPVCFCELSKLVCNDFPYINLEDDMGVSGLRTMKSLYHPLFLLDSYTARIGF